MLAKNGDDFLITGKHDYVSELFDASNLQIRTKAVRFCLTPVHFVLSISQGTDFSVPIFLALLTVTRS